MTTCLEDNHNKKLTALQWWSMGYDIKHDACGIEEWNNRYCAFKVTRYTSEEAYPSEDARQKWRAHRNRIAKKSREKIAREKVQREMEEAWEKEFEQDYFTAWQMLSRKKRVPIDGSDYYEKTWWFRDKYHDKWIESEYCYYDIKKSRRVSDEEFDKLKALYIDKYGGWDSIDLSNTDYNGKIWW